MTTATGAKPGREQLVGVVLSRIASIEDEGKLVRILELLDELEGPGLGGVVLLLPDRKHRRKRSPLGG